MIRSAVARRALSRWEQGLLVGALVLCARAGWAQPALDLQWTAPPGCPGPDAVRREVEHATPGTGPVEPLRASVLIEQAPDGWHADVQLTTDGETHHRSFEAASCAELASAVGVVLSLVVAEQAPATEETPDEHPAPSPVPVPTARPRPELAPAATAPPTSGGASEVDEHRTQLLVRLALGTAVGYLPDTSGGIELGAGIGHERERLLVEFERWAGLHDEVERSGVAIVASRLGVGPTACVGNQHRFRVEACVGARAVLIEASGDDILAPGADQGWFGSTLLRLSARWELPGSLQVGAFAQGQVPLQRVEFHLAPRRTVDALPPWGAAFGGEVTWGK